jgi:hypothetical protein
MCDYVTNNTAQINEHAFLVHGIVKCERCDYSAEDKDIMKAHMKRHTGRIIFQCGKCEFEATRQSLLENHIEARHSYVPPQLKQKCERCEKVFPDIFQIKYHTCIPVKYKGETKENLCKINLVHRISIVK